LFLKKKDPLKFIITAELGRLARWLRILGYDSIFFDSTKKRDIVIESLREGRIILTRDARLSRFSGIRMFRIKSDFVEKQLEQVIKELRLKVEKGNIFTRCVECNTPIVKIEKEGLEDKVPPYVYKTQEDFMQCPNCKKIYWKGTHFNLANKFLGKVNVKGL